MTVKVYILYLIKCRNSENCIIFQFRLQHETIHCMWYPCYITYRCYKTFSRSDSHWPIPTVLTNQMIPMWYPCSINVKPDTHMISMRYKLQTVVLIGPINNVPSVLTNQHIFLIGLTYHWIPSYLWPLDVRSASSLCICHGLVVQWALKREMMKSSNAMGSLARITVYICSKRASGEWGLLNHSLVNIHGISSSKQHFRGAVFSNLKHDYLRYSSSILLFSPYDFLLWSTDLYTTIYIWRSA